MPNSDATFQAALELMQAAMLEARVELALSEARVAKLKAVAELERAGRTDEARVILDEVRTEQARAGIDLAESDGPPVGG
jgi:2-oxo-4-hydroxy-4-carboxy--5-ureidoimidazoline (OHCU) decarboxylase